MASRQEYEMLFQLNAQLGGSYNSTFNSAQKSITGMQKEIDSLSKTQSNISSYQKQQAAVDASKRKLEVLQQQYNNIKREMDETGNKSSDFQNKLLAKQMQIDKTSASITTQTAKLDQMGNALRSAGVNTDELAKESGKLSGKIDEIKTKQEEAADSAKRFGADGAQAVGAIQQALVAAGIVKALHEIYEAFLSCTDASMAFEDTMTGVDKTTELTNKELAAMGEAFKQLSSKEIPATTDELGQIAETAGQLGIVKDSLLDFTEIMAMLGTATNMTSSEAATMLAQMASITRMDPSFYQNLGSTIVALGNNYATTERNIADMSQTIAAAGSIAGMSEASIAAIAAAVTSLGISAQNGGTQMTKLISEINSAVSSGEGLSGWANAAGVTADEFADAWGSNAAGALDMFVRGLNATYEAGGDVYGVLRDLGITETRMVTMITSLTKSGDRLTETLQTANTAWTENTALIAEAEKRYANTMSQLTMMQNAYNNLGIAIGDHFNPELRELYKIGADVFSGMAEFIQQNPALVKAVFAFIAVLGTVIVVLAAYTIAVKIATAFTTAFAAATGVALGPILLVVAAVAALVAGVVALAEGMKPQLDEMWELTAASREQYKELEELNSEYEKAIDLHGEASYEAQQLRWRIEDLNEQYESGMQTLEDYNAAHQELIDNYAEMSSSHADANNKLGTEEKSVIALISKLKELTSTTDSAKQNQQAILSIIDALNESVPNLAISYDDVIKNAGGVVEALETAAKAQAAQRILEEQWNQYVERIGQQDALASAKKAAEENARIAQDEYDLAKKVYNDAQDMYKSSDALPAIFGTREEGAELDAAKEQLDIYNAALGETVEAYNENEAALDELEDGFRLFQQEQEAAAESGVTLNDVLGDTKKQIDELIAAYDEAYNSALSSVQGQYELWDDAAKVVATSTGKINTAMEGQITYWQDYNTNLASLSERTGDIQGLSDVIASFADGSKDSVNAVAGMASASDEDLSTMVANWKKLQEEQKTTADAIAEFETDFSKSMETLLQTLNDTVTDMDMSGEAAAAALSTVEAYIDSIENQTAGAYEAAKAVAKAAMNGFGSVTGGGVNITVNGKGTPGGYAAGTMSADPGWKWVGELGPELMYMRGGETVLPSDISLALSSYEAMLRDSSSYAQAQQLMAQMSGGGAIQAANGGGGGLIISVSPQFSISGDTNAESLKATFRGIANEIKEEVLEALDEAGIDTRRSSYK